VDDSFEAVGTRVELLRTGLLQCPFHGGYPHILLAIDCTNPSLSDSSGSPTRGEVYEYPVGTRDFLG
jgi:hypothetical protein